MFYGEEDSPFQDLPPEMIVEVLSLADLEGKQRARLVCRRWRWILDHPAAVLVFFKKTSGKMTEDSAQYLLKSQLHFDHLVLGDLNVTWPSMTYSRNKFPHIRELTLESGNSEKSLMTILQYGCTQAESLTLGYWCFKHVRSEVLSRVLSGMRWNYLTELSLEIIPHTIPEVAYTGVKSPKNWQENNVNGMELILKKARIPNLRALSLELAFRSGNDEICVEFAETMSNFMTFLEHHSKTLKELKLCFRSIIEGILISPNITAARLFSMEQEESLARDLKLESLDIWSMDFDALVHLVPPCLLLSANLTKLNWQPLWSQFWSSPPPGGNSGIWTPIVNTMHVLMAPPTTAKPMRSFIAQNRITLPNVTIRFINGDIGSDPFELSWLGSCPQLRELTITNCDKFVSVKLQLPTVRKLDIGLIEGFDSMENMSSWIARTFQNLETVQFLVHFPPELQNWEFDWIQNLLLLPRLEEIRFGFTNWVPHVKSHLHFTGPDLIRQYCSDKGRLKFRGERQRELEDGMLLSGPCLIKILPIQNCK